MSTLRFALQAALVWSALVFIPSFLFAEDPHLTEVTVERLGVGDTSHLLHIKKLTGTFRFGSKVKKATMVCEFYKKGKKLSDVPEVKATIQAFDGADLGKFAIQIADIDYLQLGDAKKNHCRVLIELQLGNSTLNPKEIDVPKYEFDLGQRLIGNGSDWQHIGANGCPIFIFSGGKTGVTHHSPTETIEGNPEGEFVVGYLDFEQ